MTKETASVPRLDTRRLGLLNLKAETLSNIFFGPPLIFLVLAYMGEPLVIIFEVEGFYLLLAIIIYGPLNYFLPALISRSVRRRMGDGDEAVTTEKYKEIINDLLDLPVWNAFATFVAVIVGFIVGMFFIQGWLVTEWHEILIEMTIVAAAIGLSVGGIQGFLVYNFTENYLQGIIREIVKKDERVLEETFRSKRFPLVNKIFVLTFLSVLAAQFSLLGLYVGRLARTSSGNLTMHLAFLFGGGVLSVSYILFAVKYFSDNILHALNRLKAWSHSVSRGHGEVDSLDVVTNDEFYDVIKDIRFMVSRLEDEQQTLQNEKDKLAVILSGIVEGVVAVGPEGDVLTMNNAAEAITGWKEDEAIGKRIQDILVAYDKSERQIFTDSNVPVQSIFVNAEPMQVWTDLRLVSKQGEEKYISVTTTHLPLANSTEQGGIFTFHDITKEKELEEMKLDFVSIAAHELRTPLTSVVGYTSVFIDENKEKFDEDQMKLLGRVQASAHQLSGLVENLLSVSKIERGALNLSFEEKEWVKIVELTVSDLHFMAQDKRIDLIFDKPVVPVPHVYIDEIRVREVLSNLISNAIHYTPPSGRIMVTIDVDDTSVITHVKDTGVGIPKEAMKKLFTKFFRVQGKLGHESKGTGLGLYISKAIVEMHKGKIWVESEIDVGSTFSFSLPRVDKNQPPGDKEATNSEQVTDHSVSETIS